MLDDPWHLLGIEPTEDETLIRRAYARQLRKYRPDEDPEGFQRLLAARDIALTWHSFTPDEDDVEAHDPADAEKEASSAPNPVTLSLIPHPPIAVAPPEAGDEAAETLSQAPDPPGSAPAALAEAQAALSALMSDGGSKFDTSALWNTAGWDPLFSAMNKLDLTSRVAFRLVVIAAFLERLPDRSPAEYGMEEFRTGFGATAVVERVEAELELAQDQLALSQQFGVAAIHNFMTWLIAARDARQMLQRRQAGKAAYWGSDGLPQFPPADKAFTIPTTLGPWFDKCVAAGHWLTAFVPVVLVFPAFQFAKLSLAPIGILFIALGIAWFPLNDLTTIEGLAIAIGSLAALFALRIPAAFLIQRLAVGAAIRRVQRADQRLAWFPPARQALLHVPPGDRTLGFLLVGDVVILLGLVAMLLGAGVPTWDSRGIRDVAPSLLWSQAVQSTLDKAVENDRETTKTFTTLFRDLMAKREQILAAIPADKNAAYWSDIRTLQNRIETYGRLASPQTAMAPVLTRTAKLQELVQAYRAAAAPQKRDIENRLNLWLALLDVADDPADEAAVWAAIPPRSAGPAIQYYAEFLQQLALNRLLQTESTDRKTLIDPDISIRDAALSLIASTDDPSFYHRLSPDFLKNVASEVMTTDRNEIVLPPRYYAERLGRSLPAVVTGKADDWTEYQLMRAAFYEMAHTCLKTAYNPASRQATRAVIAETYRDFPPQITPATSSWWRAQGRRLMADTACFQAITLPTGSFRQESGLYSSYSRFSNYSPFQAFYAGILDGNPLFARADTALEADDYATAKAGYYAYLDIPHGQRESERVHLAHDNLGMTFLLEGNPYKALIELDRGGDFGLGKEGAWRFRRRAEILLQLGEPKRALADATRAIELDDRRALLVRASIHLALSERGKALADIDAFIKDNANDAQARALRDRITAKTQP